MNAHSKALRTFAGRVRRLFLLRAGIQAATVWFFIWGTVMLAAKMAGEHQTDWFALGLLGIVPLVFFAASRIRRRLPSFESLRAQYDRTNFCGGVVMAEEIADMTAWQKNLPAADVPKLRWNSGRPMLLFSISALFAATAILLPERFARFSNHKSLEIGQIVQQLQAEVKTLAQEKILDDKKADDLQKQLSQVQKDATSNDPAKTWEALDHVKEADSDAAKQAAEEAISKTTAIAQAETLAQAMAQADDSGMSDANATEAAQDLAQMLASAKLEEGVLNAQIPPELLANLNGLNKEQLQKLLKALEFNKNSLGLTVSNLAGLKLIDAATLAKCLNAGLCTNGCDELAAYLCNCTNANAMAMCMKLGKGGPGGGGPPAPLTWNDGASEKDLKFQEHALPPASRLDQAQLVGVSRAAPQLSDAEIDAQHGALDNAAGSGGSAHLQVILPEHRQAVQKFFEREGN
ncbi:MAG TPA: hypothetical protein VFV23_04935 [Verrucomicrobiae bacterium]|nr:hypothetical protein [Verrucomicrobiae bacterium]